MRTLRTGIVSGESLRWHNGRLWFSDWGRQQITAVDPNGESDLMLALDFPSWQPICFDWLPDGRLVVVASKEGRLLVRERDGSLHEYADLSQVGSGMWNEPAADARGNVYVNGGTVDPTAGDEFAPG